MKIVISGPAKAFDLNGQCITDIAKLESIEGLEYGEEVCATYLDEPLTDIGIEGGTLRISFDKSSKSLRVVTEYGLSRKLKKLEMAALVEHTKGQWSDGIGEGCFSSYREEKGIEVSVFPIPYDDHDITVLFVEDGAKTQKPSPLLQAAKKGDCKKLQSLLEKGENIEAKGQWELTPLMCAVSHEHIEAVSFLVSRNANVNYKTTDGVTSIQLASMQGNLQALLLLLQAGANVNERNGEEMTPLMWAANRGYQDALQLLINHGADINAQDSSNNRTALNYVQPDRLDIVEYLLRQGADPKVLTKDGLTASGDARQQAEREKSIRPERAVLYEGKAQLLQKHES